MTKTEISRQGPTDAPIPEHVRHVGFVAHSQNDIIVICNPSPYTKEKLAYLGGEFTKDEWILMARGETEIAALFDILRTHGVPFGGAAHGWPPAAIFELYREKGLLTGNYREILFYGPDRGWEIYER